MVEFNPLPDDNILDRSNLKQPADDNSKFDENRRNFSKQVENTVGKGEIACYEQFLLFPKCFQKTCYLGASKSVIVWEWVKIKHIYFTSIERQALTTSASWELHQYSHRMCGPTKKSQS